MVRDAVEIMGGLSILFNNAMANPLDTYSEDERWNVMLESGLTAYWAAAVAAAPHLAQSGHGAIVQTASIAGAKVGIAFASEAYCAAKAGIVGLTRKLAKRLGPDNVRVNCIAPGVIKTPRLAYSGADVPEFAVRSQKMTPLQRLGTADEVAELVLFLASDQSSYITGQDIAIDGGLAIAPLFESVDLP
jgi:NAD(P)-dependent dehydrogenase (short-subunit alcohol dehydrogenase family)